jgi:hypothetical protein
MSANHSDFRSEPLIQQALVQFSGRDSFWEERHRADAARPRRARKKWQCLACGECGFVETVFGEDRNEIVRRIRHGCQPECIAFYSPGAHVPLKD